MKLLFVNSCISQRGEASRTLALARAFLDTWKGLHPEAEVETVAPEALLALKPFEPEMLNDRDALAGIRCFDAPVFDLARQFRAASRIVVAAPFWDLTFPAALRTYIEYISANGLTYHYEADGCHGDCRGEKLVYLTSGGDVERPESLGVLYWKQLCAMFGIPAFDYVFAGGLDLDPAKTEEILAEACEKARRLAETF
ncbi:NAD(P)H-dependent oxidoreductase [uncultured Oscillibacter sp.]|uniref:NAD(P)H-dependent oxidoreductase n=1 Tax=uncultured Oscillibacter sp. TaxID=876091 RepID=UPI0025FB4F2F|nr:NAD(P)H-dependent oxidoreductase [uncultured Oscillibacter sp.]